MGFFAKWIQMAEEDETRRGTDFEIRGAIYPRKSWHGDSIELEPDGKDKYNKSLNCYLVIHDDHPIGWISSSMTLDELEDHEDLKLVFKNDGKLYMRYLPEEDY